MVGQSAVREADDSKTRLPQRREQNKRLNAARFQLDVTGVPDLIVARADAEAANLIDGRGDERDQPFLVGATNPGVPGYKPCFLPLSSISTSWESPSSTAISCTPSRPESNLAQAAEAVAGYQDGKQTPDAMFDSVASRFLDAWEDEAGLNTLGEAFAELIEFRASEGEPVEMSVDEWRRFAARASLYAAREKARALGVDVDWDCEAARTPEEYYQVRGGIPYAIANRWRPADCLLMRDPSLRMPERICAMMEAAGPVEELAAGGETKLLPALKTKK